MNRPFLSNKRGFYYKRWLFILVLASLTLLISSNQISFASSHITVNSFVDEKSANDGMCTLREAIIAGAAERVRPKMMTVFAIVGGLIPIMWGTGAGASVMKRIAAPMIGGMVSATVLTLFVIPVAYELLERRKWDQATSEESS